MWTMKTVFVGVESEHGNWSAVSFDTEAEAWSWWNAPATKGKNTYDRVQTMTDPSGNVVKKRVMDPKNNC